MRKRDRAILDDLKRFRVMSRDDIIDLHFAHLKQAVTVANNVLKRLRRDDLVEANTTQQPYLYFPKPLTMRKDSQKIPHFLEIVKLYREISKHGKPSEFVVEPKYSDKGRFMEPDAFMIWKGRPFFIEVQRNVYTKKVMQAKLARYEAYHESELWKHEPWQSTDRKVFPLVLMFTARRYAIESDAVRVLQVETVADFMRIADRSKQPKSAPVQQRIVSNGGIKFNLR